MATSRGIRFVGPILMAAVAVAGCAPTQTGGERSASPAAAPAQASPSTDAESPEVEASENPGPDDYGY